VSALDLSCAPQAWGVTDDTSWPCRWKGGSVIGAGRCREWQAECGGCEHGRRAATVVLVALAREGKQPYRVLRTCPECGVPWRPSRHRSTICSDACLARRRSRQARERETAREARRAADARARPCVECQRPCLPPSKTCGDKCRLQRIRRQGAESERRARARGVRT